MRKWFKKWLNLIFILLIFIFTIVVIVNNNEIVNIYKCFNQINKKMIFLAILFMAMNLFLEACMINILLKSDGKKLKFRVSLKSMFIGQYYSMLTPFASGGQPMQFLQMIKDGISGAFATAVLVNKFLFFQIGVTIYSIVLLLFDFEYLKELIRFSYGFIGIGISINFFGLATLVLMVFKPKFIKHIIDIIMDIVYRVKVFFINSSKKSRNMDSKRLFLRAKAVRVLIDQKRSKRYAVVDEITNSVQLMLFDNVLISKMWGFTFLQLSCYFLVTYFVYRSFGLNAKSPFNIMMLQAMHYISISLLPAPGSAGVAEGGFLIIFKDAFPAKIISSALLIWRGITYYLNLIVSSIVTISIGFGNIGADDSK